MNSKLRRALALALVAVMLLALVASWRVLPKIGFPAVPLSREQPRTP